jgi:hypothetical protein
VDKWDDWEPTGQLGTIQVILPRIGSFVTYSDKSYVILSTVTYQEDSGEVGGFLPKLTIHTLCRLLAIDAEGEELGEEAITVKADELTII